jgi:hypothetical protein
MMEKFHARFGSESLKQICLEKTRQSRSDFALMPSFSLDNFGADASQLSSPMSVSVPRVGPEGLQPAKAWEIHPIKQLTER